MRASEFRAGAGTRFAPPPPDRTPPELKVHRSDGTAIAGEPVSLHPQRRPFGGPAAGAPDALGGARTSGSRSGTARAGWCGPSPASPAAAPGPSPGTAATMTDTSSPTGTTRSPSPPATAPATGARRSASRRGCSRPSDGSGHRRARSTPRTATSRRARSASGTPCASALGCSSRSASHGGCRPAPRARTQDPGRREWTWDGRDQAGRFVTPGWYTVTITATTSVGTMRVARSVWVGPYRISVSDTTPSAARSCASAWMRPSARRAPDPGAHPAGRHPATRPDHPRPARRLRGGGPLRSGGGPGTLRIAVSGRDDRGHRESLARELPLH